VSSTSVSVVLSAGGGLEEADSDGENDESETVLEERGEESRRMSSTPLMTFPH
jgi:hypothetical protein